MLEDVRDETPDDATLASDNRSMANCCTTRRPRDDAGRTTPALPTRARTERPVRHGGPAGERAGRVGRLASRFREDANAEEDLVLGGYRDRVLIELAQNAADAASRAGVRGRLRFELNSADAVLRASNTGAPLDAAGVESASTLRASAKRDDAAVGRFGVGFAAVLAVSNEPSMLTNSGSVTWSLARTRADLALLAVPELADEVQRRGDALPVLRLPYASDARPSIEGFDTEVVLPLRDDAAVELVRGLLADIDAVLLLTLPSLASVEIVIDGTARELTAEPTADGVIVDGIRWIVARDHRSPRCGPAARPAGRRARPARLRAHLGRARRRRRSRRSRCRLRCPPSSMHRRPTDEPLTLPALLVAPLPLDPTRRHVAPGPLRDALLDHAASRVCRTRARAAVDAGRVGSRSGLGCRRGHRRRAARPHPAPAARRPVHCDGRGRDSHAACERSAVRRRRACVR